MLVACLLACVEATATAAGKPQRPQKSQKSQKPQKKGLHKRREAKRAEKHKAKKRAETRAEKLERHLLHFAGYCHNGISPNLYGECSCNDGITRYFIDYKNDGEDDCDDGEDECGENCASPNCGCLDAANPADVKTFLDAAITNGQTQAVLQAWSEAGSCK